MSISGDIYAGRPPQDVPAYPFAEAGWLAGVPVSTLRSWGHLQARPFTWRAAPIAARHPAPQGSEAISVALNTRRYDRLGMQAALLASHRVEYDKQGRAVALLPLLGRQDAPKSIVTDPRRAFGRPALVGTPVPAADVRARFDAGDGVGELARDYDVSRQLIEDALRVGAAGSLNPEVLALTLRSEQPV